MATLELRNCPECGIVEHTVTTEQCICLRCGAVNESQDLDNCRFDECPNSATHLVVYNPVGEKRRSEYYCAEHAQKAAREAAQDEAGDLFLGPKPIEADPNRIGELSCDS